MRAMNCRVGPLRRASAKPKTMPAKLPARRHSITVGTTMRSTKLHQVMRSPSLFLEDTLVEMPL